MWAVRLVLIAHLVAVVRCDWLGSPLSLTPEKVASSVAYRVLVSDDDLDSTCYPGTDKMQRADVALAYPDHSPYCSGSLVQGPQGRTFILTARHCANPMWEDSIYPIRSYFVLFDYKLPCNASEARPASFQKAVQGVSLLYMDIHTDTMVLELHSDVPPEWGQYTAGIHAIGHSFNRTILGLGHLSGDAQKFHAGDVIGACNDSSLYTKEPEHVDCTKHNCGFYQVLMHEGNPGPGCSGSGVLDEHGDALVGILNGLTDNLKCPTDFPDNDGENTYSIYGSLAATWQHGMYAVFEGKRDKPPTTTYQPHKRPVPTISIGNTSPIIYNAEGPTHVSIKLQQLPLQGVVTMTVKNLHPQLITTNATQLVFTLADWNVTQTIEIVPGPRKLKIGQAEEFGLVLRWNVVREDGVQMHRTKHIRGMLWNARPGSDMVTQLPITALPFSGNYDLQNLLPDKEIGRQIGNADPAIYFQYTPETTQGINATVCWTGGPADRRKITVKFTTQSYLSHWMQLTEDSVGGCTSTVALLAKGEAVTLVALRSLKPIADKIDPFPAGVSYPFSIQVEALPTEQTLFALTGPGGLTFTDEPNFVFDVKAADTRPTPIIIKVNETTTEIISTCYTESVWPADIALLDDNFNVLRRGEVEPGLNCQAMRRQQLIGNRTYFLQVKPAAPALVTKSSASRLIKIGMQPYSS